MWREYVPAAVCLSWHCSSHVRAAGRPAGRLFLLPLSLGASCSWCWSIIAVTSHVVITWGPYKCNPIDSTTNEPLRLEYQYEGRNSWVYVSCFPETNVPGSFPLVVQVSRYHGNADAELNTYMVDGQGKRYHYQQYPVITSISPQSGSLAGGTLVSIIGDGFLQVDSVLVGGEPCDVATSKAKEITCYTRPAPEGADLNPGGRGLLLEYWVNQTSLQSLDVFSWNTSDAAYVKKGIIGGGLTTEEPNDQKFYSRLTGYFVPPRTGEYTFYVRGDDYVHLWLSNNSNPANAAKVAFTTGATWSFTGPSQRSPKLTLLQNQHYYLETRHNDHAHGSSVVLAVALHQTEWTHKDVNRVVNDIQLIETMADAFPEKQVIRVVGQKEVQRIDINISSCETVGQEGCTLSGFTVTYDGQSADFTTLNTSQELEDALNSLSSLQSNPVTVTLDEDDTSLNFTVYFSKEESVTEMIDLQYTGNKTITITEEEVTDGEAGVAPEQFTITYDGVESTPLTFSMSAQEVEDALVEMTGLLPLTGSKPVLLLPRLIR
nr:fibrocystin-L-like [Lytechinus pictus]